MKERKIQVFLSSTFRDMNAERDHLVNKVFPRIVAFCKEHHVEFIPLDLRWGITEEEQRNGRVITTCLQEVDNSRPFFIGLLGERYGWIPSINDLRNIPSTCLSNFKWIENDIAEGLSITEMEMQYAALRNNNIKHAAFYLRSPNIESTNPAFRESSGSLEEKRLKALKQKIMSQDTYPSVIYESIEDLGNRVYDDIIKMVLSEFPPLPSDRSEDHAHKFIMQQRLHSYVVDRESDLAIDKWFAGAGKSLLITGASGTGKSSLVCNWVQQMFDRQSDVNIIYHDYSLNYSDDNEPLYSMAEHINQELKYQFKLIESHKSSAVGCLGIIPKVLFNTFMMMHAPSSRSERIDNTMNDFHQILSGVTESKGLFKKVKNLKNVSICIIIDNIDFSEEGLTDTIKYIEAFPANVKVILTAKTGSSAVKMLKESLNCEIIQEPSFSDDMSLQFSKKYLERHGKRFSDKQYELLNKCKFINSPVLIQVILNRLISFGSFEELDGKLLEYATIATSDNLLWRSLKEIIEEFDDLYERNPLEVALLAIAISKHGLTEAEIQKICQFKPIEWSIVQGHVDSMCQYSQRRFVIKSQLYRDIIFELALSKNRNFVLSRITEYFEALIDWKTRSDGSYADGVAAFDADLLIAETSLNRRQVEALPNIYIVSAQYDKLYNYISYVLNDKYISRDDRKQYWALLKSKGYTAEDIKVQYGDNMKPSDMEIGRFYDNYFCVAVEDGNVEDVEIFARKDGAELASSAVGIRTLLVYIGKKMYKLFFVAYKNSFYVNDSTMCLANYYASQVNIRLDKKQEAIGIANKNIDFVEQNNLPIGAQAFVAIKFAEICLTCKEVDLYKRAMSLLDKVYDYQIKEGLDKALTLELLNSQVRILIHSKSYKNAEPLLEKYRQSADLRWEKGFKSYLPYFYHAYVRYNLANYACAVEAFSLCIHKMSQLNINSSYDFFNSYIFLGYSYCYVKDREGAFKVISIINEVSESIPQSLKPSIETLRTKISSMP